MSAEILRKAASLMRSRAEAATQDCADPLRPDGAPWVARPHHARRNSMTVQTEGETYLAHYVPEHAARHIASWHPAVALAVADWLDRESTRTNADLAAALATARAYLGDSA